MACCVDKGGLVNELNDLVTQIGACCDGEPACSSCQPGSCYTPCTIPFAQVTMTCPPPIMAPTRPEPVKPLQLPCPINCNEGPQLTPAQHDKFRIDNFYNYYNVDYHCVGKCPEPLPCKPKRCCEDYTKRDDCEPEPGCPTGFKPCSMKLTPPPCCHPMLPWCAKVQPCPPKPKNKSNKYVPGPCTRPCCKHWKPKEGPCLYDDPCKAHCFNHPPGIKPSGRFP